MIQNYIRVIVFGISVSLLAPNNPLRTSLAFSIIAYMITEALIPRLMDSFISIGLKGRDMSKPPPAKEIAESMGVVSAVTYLFIMFWMIPFVFFKYLVSFSSMSDSVEVNEGYRMQYSSLSDNRLFPHNKLAEYLSALLCLQSTVLLGIFDDLFDIRWRHKLFLPAVASIPLLIVYYVDFSVTAVVVPEFVINSSIGLHLLYILSQISAVCNRIAMYLTGLSFTTLETSFKVSSGSVTLLDLGILYYGYMAGVAIFAPNSINILAGINGLETGQSVVLAIVFLLNDACYLFSPSVSQAAYDSHLFSAIFLIPFLGVSLALLKYNWCPARAFVGDTYCYFSGMVFAIVGILGHFSKTSLAFFLPQIVNFIYSSPQLFLIIPCPRHRLPKFNVENGKLYPSYGVVKTPGKMQMILLYTLKYLRLIDLQDISENYKGATVTLKFSNLTIINLALYWLGPCTESTLCTILMALQLFVGITMIFIRHTLGPWLLGYDNLSWGVK